METIMGVLASFWVAALGSFFSLAISFLYFQEYKRRKFSGYSVVVLRGSAVLTEKHVGIKKAETILDDESDLSVFLKGIVSPFDCLSIDLVSHEALDLGLLKFQNKTWFIDLSKSPPKE